MQLTARTWVAATAVLALLLVLASWFLVIGPVRADAASLRTQVADTQARNDQLVARTTVLRRQFANLPDKEAELAALESALPADVELPTLIRALDAFADETGVTVMSIAPGAAVAVVDPAGTASGTGTAATATATGTGATTDGAAATGTDPAAATPAPDATTPAPAEGAAAPGVLATPVTTTVIGDFFDAQAFLRRLQADMPRAFLVRGLSVTAEVPQTAAGGRPSTSAGDVTMTVTADVFSRPAADGSPEEPVPTPGASAAPAPSDPTAPAPSAAATPAPGASPAPGQPDGASTTPAPGAAVPTQAPADLT